MTEGRRSVDHVCAIDPTEEDIQSHPHGGAEFGRDDPALGVEVADVVAVGRSDGRSILLVPEQSGGEHTGIVLLQIPFADDPAWA